MPSLKNLLDRTMLFTAATDSGRDAYAQCKVDVGASAAFVAPASQDAARPVADRPVWGWSHDGATPARVTDLRAYVPTCNMPMVACESIEVENASVTIDGIDGPVSLPLTSAYVLAKYVLPEGKILPKDTGWWQLEAHTDPSLLVVFGYEVPRTSGGLPKPLALADVEALGTRFFPVPDVDASDPDAPPVPQSTLDALFCSVDPYTAAPGQSVTAYVAPIWVVVAFGLTTCKQRADFEPGGILGAGRLYPHVMVSCNQRLAAAAAKIRITRPATTMQHDPEMQADIGGIFVADTNQCRALLSKLYPKQLPARFAVPPPPLWSNFFDYYDLAPPVWTEFTCVDPARSASRTVTNGILRESADARLEGSVYETQSSFTKVAGQGDYDNLHLAPKMQFFNPLTGTRISNIAMAPFCIHDCLHTHVRWGNPLRHEDGMPKSNIGFDGRKPYRKVCAPLVPSNQAVYITFTSPHAIAYRATAAGPITPATWTVFCHHGSAYALSIESPATFIAARTSVAASVTQLMEPYTSFVEVLSPFDRMIDDVDPSTSVAAFYRRLQFTGTAEPNAWMPRIKILDIGLCRAS